MLRAAGHEVHPLTLSGLAEKRGVPADLETHVRDVIEEADRCGPGGVVLVGHSYSGIPVGLAAERLGERLRRVVFVDAGVPVAGESFLGAWDTGEVAAAIAAEGGLWAPPDAEEFAGQGLTGEQIARLLSGAVPHPGATLTEPAAPTGALAGLPVTYVKCLLDGPEPMPAVAKLLGGPSWELVRMDTGHWPMFSQPEALARILDEAAARP
ncbi:hypothetical protein GCM10020256_04190 [Streptomyces thermocoprophilus]